VSSNKNIYFSGLNVLRFFAALGVIVTHIDLIKEQMKFHGLHSNNKLVFELGGLGVVFFFVLSGFLITYLLLKEKEQTVCMRV
jgi:peptidoglycan/LPS O-acetylase OafA/YrhL